MPDLTRILTVAALAATLHCGGGSSGTPYQPPKPFTAEVTFRSARNIQKLPWCIYCWKRVISNAGYRQERVSGVFDEFNIILATPLCRLA